jgi:hypothetical protein
MRALAPPAGGVHGILPFSGDACQAAAGFAYGVWEPSIARFRTLESSRWAIGRQGYRSSVDGAASG